MARDRMAFVTRLVLCALVSLPVARTAHAAVDATLFRLFLTDGTSVVSFGEFARVGDRVVFSMPVGGPDDQPRLHVVTIPADTVDWERTERYAASARYQHYAETRGEEDFARLTNDVARVLNEIALTTNRSRALAYAEEARAALAAWPRQHYGYRQTDVNEIVGLLDESISDLRAALGISAFDLSLTANPAERSLEPLLGLPDPREQLDQILRVAALAERPSDRMALLQSAALLLVEKGAAMPAADVTRLRESIDAQIRDEQLVDERYGELSQRLMASASEAAARAKPRDVEEVLDEIPREDARLGHRRPDAVSALRASVMVQLDAARRLRLLRDRWTIRRALYREYQQSVGAQILQLVKMQPALEAIRHIDGPAPRSLVSLRARLAGGAERLSRVDVPRDLQAAHDLLIAAWRFAEAAVNGRYDAVRAGSLATARKASSAAAGSLMLLSRTQEEIRELLEPPQLR